VVDHMSAQGREVVEKFSRQFVQYGRRRRGRRYVTGHLHDYFAWRGDRRECRFHIHVLDRFDEHLKACGIGHESLVERFEEPLPVAREIELPINTRWTLRDYQEPAVDYIMADGEPRSRFIGLQTGKGKGITSLFGMSRLRLGTLIAVLPKYIEKWVLEIREICNVELEDIMVVRGVQHLKALLAMAASGTLRSPIVIISSKTLQRWINVYERYGEATLGMGYACLPDQLMGWIGAGFRLIDEVHEHFAMQFRFDLYTHCQRSLSLSATLLHSDGFLNRMYEIAYPSFARYKGPAYDRYVRVTALFYRFRHPDRIRYRDPISKNYSHQRFELSILKDPGLLARYLNLIDGIVRSRYLRGHIPGERLAVFFTTVGMCTRATEFFRDRYPDLDVRRYVEEDPFENAITPDIRNTTLLSGGTAIDIPNLTTVILTIAISSLPANLQVLGRLRRLTSGRTPEFIYLNCMDILQHHAYHERKVELFRYRALHHDTEYIHTPI
jgi:hypothetical protein